MQHHFNCSRTSSISLDETVLTLPEAAAVIPTQNGKKPSVSTIWRWCRKGLRGVQLEYLRCGRRILTSREALDRFFLALAASDERPEFTLASSATPGSTNNARVVSQSGQTAITRAHEELEREGF